MFHCDLLSCSVIRRWFVPRFLTQKLNKWWWFFLGLHRTSYSFLCPRGTECRTGTESGCAWKRDVSCSCATLEHKMQRLWFINDRSTERERSRFTHAMNNCKLQLCDQTKVMENGRNSAELLTHCAKLHILAHLKGHNYFLVVNNFHAKNIIVRIIWIFHENLKF